MRADMFKVIVERPRWGSRHAPPVKLKKDKNDFKRIGLKRHVRERADYSKSLNENLAPLVRFLQRRIGRRWDVKRRSKGTPDRRRRGTPFSDNMMLVC